jgi:penicillin-binding protein 1A
MAKGYATLANNGEYSDRTCIRKIEHTSDGVIYKDAEETTQVYSEDAAWMMTDVLKGVFDESYGTAHALKLDGGQITAGKTGTTNSSKDVWFCGYSAYYTTVVWCGYDTPRAMPGTYGATLSGAIWKQYMNAIHTNLEPKDFDQPETICLAKYDSSGKIIEGTEVDGSKTRTYGMDYFSTDILEETTEYVDTATDKSYQKKVLKKLKKFEKMTITTTADYYTFTQSYNTLSDMVANIKDDDVRKEYSTRLKDKYDSLKDESLQWKDVVEAYEQQQSEENERLAEESARKAETAREEQTKKTRIALANTRLKRLLGHKYQPDNVTTMIKNAQKAVNACREYSEYSDLQSKYEQYSEAILALPTKAEYQASKTTKTPANRDTETDTETDEEE